MFSSIPCTGDRPTSRYQGKYEQTFVDISLIFRHVGLMNPLFVSLMYYFLAALRSKYTNAIVKLSVCHN
jgi:hypothetical protein